MVEKTDYSGTPPLNGHLYVTARNPGPMEPLYNGCTLGEHNFGCYIGVAFIEESQNVHLGPGFLAVTYRGGLYSGVAVKRGSTVYSGQALLGCSHSTSTRLPTAFQISGRTFQRDRKPIYLNL